MAKLCYNHQRYQSLATERICILLVSLEKQIGHVLVAMVVIPEVTAAVYTNRLPISKLQLLRRKDRPDRRSRQILAESLSGKSRKYRFENAPMRLA